MTEQPEIPAELIDRTPPSADELRNYAQQALQLAAIVQNKSSQAALLSVARELAARAALLEAPVVVIAPTDRPTSPSASSES